MAYFPMRHSAWMATRQAIYSKIPETVPQSATRDQVEQASQRFVNLKATVTATHYSQPYSFWPKMAETLRYWI